MARRKTTPLTSAEASARIVALCKKPRDRWKREDEDVRDELVARAPADTPGRDRLLDSFDVDELGFRVPMFSDAAIVASLEARSGDPDAACALAALRTNPKAKVRDVLGLMSSLCWAGRAKRAELAKLVKKHPEIVEGARAAMALSDARGYVTDRYLPVLAAEASADSLDLLVPYIEKIVKEQAHELDWFRKEVVPLLGDTPAAKDVTALLARTVDDRTEKSPARAFAKRLGMVPPPPVLQATLSFRDRAGKTVYQIRIDSTKAAWLQGRRNEKWLWRSRSLDELAKELPAERTSYVLRVSKGDRAKLAAWAKAL
jgi:hypothetical protein